MAGPPVRRSPYKDTLQPALHRRFSSTAILLLAASYLEAVVLANWNSYLWSWFPIGPAGFRTLLIFSCGLSTLILRIAHYHVGMKTNDSGLQVLTSSLTALSTYETGFWYGISSFFFCPIFLSSAPESANLKWITYFSGDRPRLNERPIFLACCLFVCALWQTVYHHKADIDRLDLDVAKHDTDTKQKGLKGLPKSFQTVVFQLPGVLGQCIQQAVSSLFLCLFLYYFLLRSFAWGWVLAFLRPFYNLPKATIVPPTWPTDAYLLARCVYAGTMVNFVWAAGNTAFSVFMVKEPLKNGNPLTSESKDPNGSLLNGLKSKKLSIKAFAMWELALIAQGFEARRQAIYYDIDRKDGPMWSQVYTVCMELFKQIDLRIDEFGRPTTLSTAQPAQTVEQKPRTSAPLRQDPIFTKQGATTGLLSGMEKAWDQVARAPGSSPVSELSPLAKKTWKDAKDRVLTKEQQNALSPDHIRAELEHWSTNLLNIHLIGGLFRRTFRTRFAGVVLGTPYAEPALYIHATQALCQLAVHSLSEDQFGNVHRDVPSIIRSLTTTIRKIESLKQRFPVHWTDTSGSKESPEIDQVLDALRCGLEQVVTKFEPFQGDLRLSLSDLRLAKEAMERPTSAAEPAHEAQEPKNSSKRKSLEEKKAEPAKGHGRESMREMFQLR